MIKFANRHGIQFILASIAVNALIGIIAIVSGDFSDFDGKVLVTSLSVTGASVLALANLTVRERGGLRYVPEVGAVASVIGFTLLVIGVWGEFSNENLIKSSVTGILIGIGTAHGALLSLSKLKQSYIPVLWSAWGLAGLLILLFLILIWFNNAGDSTAFLQTMGVTGVLLAAATIAVPILHWATGREKRTAPAPVEVSGEMAVRRCPNCGGDHIVAADAGHRCQSCGASFSVTFSGES